MYTEVNLTEKLNEYINSIDEQTKQTMLINEGKKQALTEVVNYIEQNNLKVVTEENISEGPEK